MKKTLNLKDQIFISWIIVLGIIIVLCFIAIFQPILKRIMEYNKEEEKVKTQLNNASIYIADKERLSEEISSISKKIAVTEKRLPKETDIPQVLNELVKIGEKSQVTFISIEPQEIEIIYVGKDGKKNYQQIPIELKLKAGYHEFALFVNGVENFPQFMRVDKVKITGEKGTKAKNNDISLTVSAFALEDKK